MDEQNVKNEKKKELLNIYWFLLMVMAAISLVNLLAISTDSMKAAAIVNVVLLFAIPLTFVLGYIDFRNFAPMSVKKSSIWSLCLKYVTKLPLRVTLLGGYPLSRSSTSSSRLTWPWEVVSSKW